ncbi:cardiomyopathy-associated protein 5 [Melanotaenia boesemani]|uniref:cardiomyopathy-associated protein 5 n=1 Tax=Melanotaenia boesemani TaxID=1250792 RepID=UPI001C04BE10|nr:cardiomyopathy-associated protein 5 [Melanotaenia boesemani]
MDECESLDSEMTELQECQYEASDVMSQDDEDEVEELQNSLREVVQDQSVKPKLQCLMVDPSFSMVTVQSEDSGIVWETASSRCSTPWASETSSTSEAYSMEGSGGAGKITIVFDEEKVVRRRTRSGGRSSRLGDRFSRPGSSRSASALGVERPEMTEVSLPNVKQEKTKPETDLEEIKTKDQQLFSLISEGYEILNIRVPSKLPTVDEEESTELQDNLCYLDQTPKIRSHIYQDWAQQQSHNLPEEEEIPDHTETSKQDSSQPSAERKHGDTPTQKEDTGDIDYFEKFTLLDVVVPAEQTSELQEEAEKPVAKPQTEEPKPAKEVATDSPSASEDSFVFVTDVEIVGEHLDEVFYGEGPPADALQQREEDREAAEARMRGRRESQRSTKESGAVLFESEETTLTPIFISPGPPKIIDPILLEEPTAMSFMYSDLYEDAVGERRRSDDDSEAESMAFEKSYKRRLSDSEEADGYLEKFILKDETQTVDVQDESVKDKSEGRMMWPQSKFETTGCLIRVAEEDNKELKMQEAGTEEDCHSAITEEKKDIVTETEEEKGEIQLSAMAFEQAAREVSDDLIQEPKLMKKLMEAEQEKHEVKTDQLEPPEVNLEMAKTKTGKPKMLEAGVEKDFHSAKTQREKEIVTGTEEEKEEIQLPRVSDEQTAREASENLTQETKLVEEQMEIQQVQHEVERDQTESLEPSPEKPPEAQQMDIKAEETHEIMDHQRDDKNICEMSCVDTEQPCEPQMVAEKMSEVLVGTTDTKALIVPVSTERLPESSKSDTKTENTERILSEEDAADSKVVAADEKLVTEAETEASAQAKAPETVKLSSTEPLGEMEKPAEAPLSEVKEAAPEDVTPVEVFTDCDCSVQTVVEVTETAVNEKEIQTQVKINLQEVTNVEATNAQTDVPERERETKFPTEETAAEVMLPKYTTKAEIADQESGDKTQISAEVIKSVMPEKINTESAKKHQEIIETEQKQQELTDKTKSESNKTKLIPEANSEMPADDNKASSVQDIVNVGDELILLVPKGQVVEMDIEISKWSEKTGEDTVPEPDNTCDFKALEPETEVEPETAVKEKELPINSLDGEYTSPVPGEEVKAEEQKMELEEDKIALSNLRSFTPLEDLTGLHKDDVQSPEIDAEQKEMQELKDAPETNIYTDDTATYIVLDREDVGSKKEQDEKVLESPEVPVDKLGYEVISKQDAKDMPQSEIQIDVTESEQNQEGEMEIKVEIDQKVELVAEEELNEADYEIIDAEEESQARLAAELEGMDWFCVTCGCLLSEEYKSAEHQGHELNSVDKAYEEIKDALGGWISELQARSENIEDLVSELELAYNSVEDQFVESEAVMQAQNEEMMALVMEQYHNMSVSMEEEKKAKLEQLYDKIVSFQENIDSAKTTLETTVREAETDARSPEDIHTRLKGALDSALSLELGPKGLLVFEDYAKANTSSSNLTQRKGIPVPQMPTLQPQESGSATSTSVTVYWKVNPGDIIDCFQVYCMEDPQGAVTEEYRVTVKESYCVLEELEPDKMYKVWVMAVNYTGCSLPSERLVFRTGPSVPVIDTERCTVMWDSATLRWSSTKQSPRQTYTLEYCRQYELEGEGLRSISGIKTCEQRVFLQPKENYLFYIKGVNDAGASEQSEAALISTKGTRFHLLRNSAHPALELSEDQTTLQCSQDAHNSITPTDKVCPSILGDLLPARGLYYWETVVSGSTAYRVGVAYNTANKNSSLGDNSSSWCLQCVPTESGCRYQLLHNGIQSSMCVIKIPERVGTLLDYQQGLLSFYNAQSGQLLGTFRQHFTQSCHPALALERPGSLQLCLVLEVPEFTKDS